ncbi:hypothetical protein MSMEG_6093 [Mycolicibacterium smegmatis MC2 155]|uniref:Uncharacterized protein n=1 Tax=Mycolicibacterium smegmatis (strain ATCC 700084 / mc(2)155) TaxID=246196 RepID=A0R575_MYCS2|nr:hypothetical protein MSMEG_6093 [Mycolicibacterium smegmatis MC2 155]
MRRSFPDLARNQFARSEKRRTGECPARRAGNLPLSCRVECVDHVGRNPAAGRHIVSVAAGPFADRSALLTVDGTAATGRGGRGATAFTSADATARLDPLLQIVAQLRGVFCGKVDLIGHTVEAEFHRFVGRGLTVEIIDKRDGHFLCHSRAPTLLLEHW